MEWGGCLSPRGCPRCPWDSQGRESTVVNHPIQKLNLSTNLKKEFSNYVIFGWHSNHHGFVLTRYIHSAPILVANLFMSPRDKMNSSCAQQKTMSPRDNFWMAGFVVTRYSTRNLEHSWGCIGFISAGFTPFANPRPVVTAARAGLTRISIERGRGRGDFYREYPPIKKLRRRFKMTSVRNAMEWSFSTCL